MFFYATIQAEKSEGEGHEIRESLSGERRRWAASGTVFRRFGRPGEEYLRREGNGRPLASATPTYEWHPWGTGGGVDAWRQMCRWQN